MNRIASILTGLTLAVLFFVGAAHAQSEGHRMIANIPFEFSVGNILLPAGQYEFLRTGTEANIVLVRDAEDHVLYTQYVTSIDANEFPEKSALKFAVVDGHHVLAQLWDEFAGVHYAFRYGQTYAELAEHTTIPGTVTGRR